MSDTKKTSNPTLGAMFALFLPADRVVEFIDGVLGWYKEAASGQGRVRLGTLLIYRGPEALLQHLRGKFREFIPAGIMAPQPIDIQVGMRPAGNKSSLPFKGRVGVGMGLKGEMIGLSGRFTLQLG